MLLGEDLDGVVHYTARTNRPGLGLLCVKYYFLDKIHFEDFIYIKLLLNYFKIEF